MTSLVKGKALRTDMLQASKPAKSMLWVVGPRSYLEAAKKLVIW